LLPDAPKADEPASGGHVIDEVFDYLEQRLSPERLATVRAHLESCVECAAIYAQAESFHKDVAQTGARHLSPERLVQLADNPKSRASPAEQTHLTACDVCREQLDWLRSLPPPPELEEGRSTAREWLRGLTRAPRWGWGLALAAVAACVIVIVSVERAPEGPSFAGLARREPLELQWPRGGAGDAFAEAYLQGLRAYAAGDYVAAESSLAEAARLDPTHQTVLLALGSAQLLGNRPRDAIKSLNRARTNARDPGLAAEVAWQLANAYLAAEEPERAKSLLMELQGTEFPRAESARILLGHIAQADR